MTPQSSHYQNPSPQEIHIPEIVSRFLKSRGFLNKEDQIEFLNPLLKEIKDPYSLRGMDSAVTRLVQASLDNEKVGVYCDYDLDGSSSAAILKTGLISLGFPQVEVFQPRRLTDGYGFHNSGVDYFKERDVNLIVTADVGITSHKTVDYAKSLGIDVIVTDHHLPDETLPEAHCVINPNTSECRSGLGYLCGAGVAFYLIYALAKKLKKKEKLTKGFKLEDLLDYLVIGTLTDMVPLVKENRTLVKRGLAQFTKTTRPGLRAMKVKEGLMGKTISSTDIGFKIAPKLNSLSRLDTDLRPTDILLEESRDQAEGLVTQAYNVNSERLETLESGLNEALEHFESHAPDEFCFFISENIHPGVMGLIATRLVDKFQLPAFIGSVLDNGQVVGSARLPSNTGLSLKTILSECGSLHQYGGHAEAAGYELAFERRDKFREEILVYLRAWNLTHDSQEPVFQDFDCEVFISELGSNFIPWLNQLEPFGTGFEPPKFKISNVEILSVKKLKNKHYKMTLTDSTGDEVEGIWFSPPEDHEATVILDAGSQTGRGFTFYVTPQINFFRNNESMQVLVNDVEVF